MVSFDHIRYRRHDSSAFLYAFDLIEINGDDLRGDPLEVRKATLANIVAKTGHGVWFNDHIEEDGETVFRHACKLGRRIAERTKEGLAAAKERGVQLGNPRLRETTGTKGAEKNREKAKAFADNVLPIIHKIEKGGAVSLRQIAAELTARKIKTPGGGDEWNPVTVSKIKRRAMA
jgi:hypothetical protein